MGQALRRWLAAAALAWFGWALPCAAQTPPDGPTGPLGLGVMSYNIRYANPGDGEDRWEKRREQVYQLIREHDPDVIGLQEALRPQLDDLGKALPAYAEIGVGRDDGKVKGEYAAILYRHERFKVVDSGTFWFSDTPNVPGSKGWGNNVIRICTWARLRERNGQGEFWLFNVHLDHESQPSREKSTDLLARRVLERSPKLPVVVTGDFNAGEQNAAVLKMQDREKGAGLLDSFRVVHPDEKQAGTFNDFGHAKGTTEKIDHIFVGQPAKVLDAGIDRRSKEGRFPSDHFAVWANLELSTGK